MGSAQLKAPGSSNLMSVVPSGFVLYSLCITWENGDYEENEGVQNLYSVGCVGAGNNGFVTLWADRWWGCCPHYVRSVLGACAPSINTSDSWVAREHLN